MDLYNAEHFKKRFAKWFIINTLIFYAMLEPDNRKAVIHFEYDIDENFIYTEADGGPAGLMFLLLLVWEENSDFKEVVIKALEIADSGAATEMVRGLLNDLRRSK